MSKHIFCYSLLLFLLVISITLNFSQVACFNSAYSISIDPVSSSIGLITLTFAILTINNWKKEKKFDLEISSRKDLHFELNELSNLIRIINTLDVIRKINDDNYCEKLTIIQKDAFRNQLISLGEKTKAIKLNLVSNKYYFKFLSRKDITTNIEFIILVLDAFSTMAWLCIFICDKEIDNEIIFGDRAFSDVEAHVKRKTFLTEQFTQKNLEAKIATLQKLISL